MKEGIYTLANDVVYDQLVALLNSIEANAGGYPVCVIAYDDRVDRVRAEIAQRPNVTLLEDPDLFKRWEDFSLRIWQTHPTALKTWQEQGISGVRRLGMNRRYGAFDPAAPFERFVYIDADALILDSLAPVFAQLAQADVVTYDFQYKDPGHIFNLQSERLHQVFPPEQIERDIFCAGFYASKRGLLSGDRWEWLLSQLQQGDSELLYLGAPNQSVLNYLILKSQLSVANLARIWPETRRTGNAVTSSHFQVQDGQLYDGGKRVTYLHYIGLSSSLFGRVCGGENITFPYRDLFLHYRYLQQPDQRPQMSGSPRAYNQRPGFTQRVLQKLGIQQGGK